MNVLIIKLGATGDVVRTTTLLRALRGDITWLTAEKNLSMVPQWENRVRRLPWGQREMARDRTYDLIINLEDEAEVATFVETVEARNRFGAYIDEAGVMRYTDNARAWFDLSLISVHGRKRADELKLENRRTYQDMVFEGLGHRFADHAYVLPSATDTGLRGDVAIATEAGAVWPMKRWAYYAQLKQDLEARGYKVNVLPTRPTLLEHLGDVQGHRCLVCGDTLPMHLALGSGIKTVAIFTCTSPWEIHEYGLLTKFVSPLLPQYFYQRGFDVRATTAISLAEVRDAVVHLL